MPVSKSVWLREGKPAWDSDFSPAQGGALMAYSLTGHKGPFRLALVDQVDDRGFITDVLHLDGSTKNILSPFSKRWVVRSELTKSPREILERVGDTEKDIHNIRELIRPFVIKGKEEKNE